MTGSAIVFFSIFELLVFYRLLEEHGRISDRLHVHDGNVEFHLVHFFPRALFTGDLRQLPAQLQFKMLKVQSLFHCGTSCFLWFGTTPTNFGSFRCAPWRSRISATSKFTWNLTAGLAMFVSKCTPSIVHLPFWPRLFKERITLSNGQCTLFLL